MPTIEELVEAVKAGDNREAVELAAKLIKEGVGDSRIIHEGLTKALEDLDIKCTTDEFNLVEILLAGRAMTDVLDIVLKPRMMSGEALSPVHKAVVVIGTIEGDIHDLGKRITLTIMTAAGLKVVDLGVDVSPGEFIRAAKAEKASFIGVSSLLTVTFEGIRQIKEAALAEGLNNIKVIAGGAAANRASSVFLNVDYVAHNDLGALRYIRGIVEGGVIIEQVK